MDLNKKAKNELLGLDINIANYVDSILPMLLPDDATKEEEQKLRKLLIDFTRFEAYYTKLNSMQTNPSDRNATTVETKHVEGEMLQMWWLLEQGQPHMPMKDIILRRSTNSRYTHVTYKEDKEQYSPRDCRKVLYSYTKRLKRKIPDSTFLRCVEGHPQVEAALAVRDIFHNGGTMDVLDFSDKSYKDFEYFISQMRTELNNSLTDLMQIKANYPNIQIAYQDQQNIYFRTKRYMEVFESMRKFMEVGKLRTYSQSAQIASKKRKEKRIEDREFAKISQTVLSIFDMEFSNLPVNEAEHEKRMESIIERVERYVGMTYRPGNTTPEQYVELVKKTYKKYMTQLKTKTLPLRLSYFPEDKELYAHIVDNARKQQDSEKKHGIERISVELGMLLVVAGVTPVVFSLASQDLVGLSIEAAIGTSAYIIKHICDNRRLKMDVEQRVAIKHKKIFEAYLEKKLYTEPHKKEEVWPTWRTTPKSPLITQKPLVPTVNLDEVQEGDGLKVQYQQILEPNLLQSQEPYVRRRRSARYAEPSQETLSDDVVNSPEVTVEEKHEKDSNIGQIGTNIESGSANIPTQRPRRRRADRYKNEQNNGQNNGVEH